MSYPRKFRKHSEEVAISSPNNSGESARADEKPHTKTVDEHYTEGTPTCTEVSQLPCSILITR